MTRAPRAVTALVLIASTAVLGACAPSGGAEHLVQRVGVAMPTTTQERWVDDATNVEAQLRALGHEVDLQYAEDDAPTQVEQIRAMVDAGVEALVVGAVDGSALTDVLAEAADAGIPVIAYDRLIRDTRDVAYYATFDNARVGRMEATMLLEGLGVVDEQGVPTGATGPFTVELFAGSPDDNNAVVFYESAMQVLQPYLDSGVLVVPSGETAFDTIATPKWDGAVAAERMRALMDGYAARGDTLDGFLSPNDGVAVAVLEVLGDAGYGTPALPWPVTCGQDADVPAVKQVAAGVQHATIYKDTRQLAEVTVSMIEALLKGEEPETNDVTSYDNGVMVVPSYLLTPQVVTSENYVEVLVDGGYYTAEEIA